MTVTLEHQFLHLPKDARAILRTITPTAEITPPAMLDRAIAQNAPVEMLERLISLKERWDANEARKATIDRIEARLNRIRDELYGMLPQTAVEDVR